MMQKNPQCGRVGLGLLLGLLGLLLAAPPAWAQSASPGTVVAGPDGTLYLVTDAGRYTLVPTAISADDLAGLPDLGTLTGDLAPSTAAAPPAASAEPAAVLAPEPESAESAEPADVPPEAPSEANPPESGGEPAAGPAAAQASPAGEAPVSVDGQSSQVSRPFGLQGGQYAVSWTAQTSNPECAFTATLHDSSTRRPVQPLGGGQVFGGHGSGQTTLHDLPGASYYVDAISTCRWSITITPLQ